MLEMATENINENQNNQSPKDLLKSLLDANPTFKLLSKEKLRLAIRTHHPTLYAQIPLATYHEYFAKDELHQMHAPVPKRKTLVYQRINSVPYGFQIDIMFHKQQKALLLIDILSRKLFAYELSNATMATILEAYKAFVEHDAIKTMDPKADPDFERFVRCVTGDDQFTAKAFQDYNKEKDITVYTTVSKSNHYNSKVSGSSLGILDRATKTLKALIQKYELKAPNAPFSKTLDECLALYNNNVHRSLYKKTPNQAYGDIAFCKALQKEYNDHNRKVQEQQTLSKGTKVRLIRQEATFAKDKAHYTRLVYTVVRRETGGKYRLKDENGLEVGRLFGFHEMMVIDMVMEMEKEAPQEKEKEKEKDVPEETEKEKTPMEEHHGTNEEENVQQMQMEMQMEADAISTSCNCNDHTPVIQVPSHSVICSRLPDPPIVYPIGLVPKGTLPVPHITPIGPVIAAAVATTTATTTPWKATSSEPSSESPDVDMECLDADEKAVQKRNANIPRWVLDVHYKPAPRPSPEERKRKRDAMGHPPQGRAMP